MYARIAAAWPNGRCAGHDDDALATFRGALAPQRVLDAVERASASGRRQAVARDVGGDAVSVSGRVPPDGRRE